MNIEKLIEGCEKYLNDRSNELILVNNGSEDKTELIIDHYCKRKKIRKINFNFDKSFNNEIIQETKFYDFFN